MNDPQAMQPDPSSGQESPEAFIGDSLKEGWEVFKKDPVLYVLAGLMAGILGMISFGILLGPLMVGFIEVVRNRMRGKSATATDIFQGFSFFVPALVVGIVAVVLISIGTALLVLPGIAAAILLSYALHFVAYGEGVGGAISGSIKLVAENFLNVFLLGLLVSIGSGVLGPVTGGIGFLVLGPLAGVIYTVAFEKLSGRE
jgi:uncharacterized membrane protein